MTQEQIRDAIEQMKVSCDLGMQDYRPMSARSTLRELGYDDGQILTVLQAIYNAGFTYCLDRHFATKDGEYPSQDVCVWGPDQLKSRLQSLYFPL
jgi:hypothetical protein